jgi:hypothetical protein
MTSLLGVLSTSQNKIAKNVHLKENVYFLALLLAGLLGILSGDLDLTR